MTRWQDGRHVAFEAKRLGQNKPSADVVELLRTALRWRLSPPSLTSSLDNLARDLES